MQVVQGIWVSLIMTDYSVRQRLFKRHVWILPQFVHLAHLSIEILGSGGQLAPSAQPHIRPPSATVVSVGPLSHRTGTLRCLQKEMAIYRHWSLWRDPDNVHIIESCPLTKLNGGLSRLHSADEDAVSWLTSYGSWNAEEDHPARQFSGLLAGKVVHVNSV